MMYVHNIFFLKKMVFVYEYDGTCEWLAHQGAMEGGAHTGLDKSAASPVVEAGDDNPFSLSTKKREKGDSFLVLLDMSWRKRR